MSSGRSLTHAERIANGKLLLYLWVTAEAATWLKAEAKRTGLPRWLLVDNMLRGAKARRARR